MCNKCWNTLCLYAWIQLYSTESSSGHQWVCICHHWLSLDPVHWESRWQVSIMMMSLWCHLHHVIYRTHLLRRMAFLYTIIFGDRLLKEPLKDYPVSFFCLLVYCNLFTSCNIGGESIDTSIIRTLVHGPHKLPTVYIHIQKINPWNQDTSLMRGWTH